MSFCGPFIFAREQVAGTTMGAVVPAPVVPAIPSGGVFPFPKRKKLKEKRWLRPVRDYLQWKINS